MYLVLDLETQTNRFHRRTASPFDPRNYIVAAGWKVEGDTQCQHWYARGPDDSQVLDIPDNVTTLVGFNIKFDLLHIWKQEPFQRFLKRGGKIWCSQYAEYLLNAQLEKFQMCSLNDVAPMYGGTTKIDAVREMWDAGVQTSDIPQDLLIDYLIGTEQEGRNKGDIGNTELIYKGQLQKAIKFKMLHAIEQRMEGLLATTMMEFNGLKIDTTVAKVQLRELQTELADLQQDMLQYLPQFPTGALSANSSEPLEFNWASDHHVSALIFGGAIKYRRLDPVIIDGEVQYKTNTERWPMVHGKPVNPDTNPEPETLDKFLSGKKKGEIKTRLVQVNVEPKMQYSEHVYAFPGYVDRKVLSTLKVPKKGWTSTYKDALGMDVIRTGSDCLEILGTLGIPFCKKLSRIAALTKEIGTYYVKFDSKGTPSGMLTCVEPLTGMLHHKLNHTSTITTRLSSNDPNLQNLPRGDKSKVKRMFASRFTDGVMIEADYSQLEVVGLAVLSNDAQLIKDLKSKVDFHCKRVALKHGIPYADAVIQCKSEEHPEFKFWKGERTKCKVFSFQSQYGAGAATISRDTGMDVEEVKALLELEAETYPGVPKFISSVTSSINSTAKPFRDPIRGFRAFRRGYYQAPTGTLYTFRSYDAPEFMKKNGVNDSFSPPEIKNYPVQGTSGEFVQCVLGQLARQFLSTNNYNNKAVLVNTVHDCIWVDCDPSVVHEVAKDIKRIMESIPMLFKKYYNMDIPVEFPVEVETGPNMYDLKHYNFGDTHE